MRALQERDRGNGVVTVSGVVRRASTPLALCMRCCAASQCCRDVNGRVCGFNDDEEQDHVPMLIHRSQVLQYCSQVVQVA